MSGVNKRMKAIKIAVVGEGPTDYGNMEYDKKSQKNIWKEGPIFPLIRHAAELFDHSVNIEAVDKHDVLKMRTQRSMRKLSGLDGKANDSARFSLFLSMRGYQYGIFYCDADKEAGTKNTDVRVCQKLLQRVYSEVETGIQKVKVENQAVVPMIPLKMIECWLMSDEKVFQELFGINSPGLPSKPELIWGAVNDPESNYPKHYLARVLNKAKGGGVECNRDTYYEIAERTSVLTLLEKCGISFQKFYDDFAKLLENVPDEKVG